MKKLYIILILLSVILVSCNKEWVAKVDGKKITLENFNGYYYAQNRLVYGQEKTNEEIDALSENINEVRRNPIIDKNNFLEQLINIELVMLKIKKEDYLKNNKEVQAFVELSKQGSIVTYYVTEKFKDKINISEADVAAYYEKNRDKFNNTPLNDKLQDYIMQTLYQTKFSELSDDLVKDLKSEYKIEKNEQNLQKLYDEKNIEEDAVLFSIDGKPLIYKNYKLYYYSHLKLQYNVSAEKIDEFRKNPNATTRNPLLLHDKFIENYIRQSIVYKQTVKDKAIENNKDMESLIAFNEKDIIAKYYIKDILEGKVKVTDELVASEYEKNRDKFENATIEQAENYIRQQLMQRNFQMEVQKLFTELKEASKIEKNTSYFDKDINIK